MLDKRTNVRYNEFILNLFGSETFMSLERIIFHIDVNSAFLSWTAVDMLKKGSNFDPRSVPSVIGGNEKNRHGIVLAKSTPTQKYNIKTGEPLVFARKKCPFLIVIPPTNDVYVEESHKMMKLLEDYSPCIEQFSIDECFLDYTNMQRHFGEPLDGAALIQKRIERELGFTVNIGISSNKLLAKMASDLSKPNKIHTLFPNEVEEKLWPLPVGDLLLVGRQTAPKLQAIGIRTIGDLAKTDIELLKFKLKSHGTLIWNYAHGIDDSKMITQHAPPKSMGISQTTPEDLYTWEQATKLLLSLSEIIGNRLRRHGYTAGGITLTIRSNLLEDCAHQMRLQFQTQCTNTIYQLAISLLSKMWRHQPLRKMGISLWALESDEVFQYDFWNSQNDRWLSLDRAVDGIKQRYGEKSIIRCCFAEGDRKGWQIGGAKFVAFSPNACL